MSPFVRPAVIREGDRTLARSVLFLLLAIYTLTFAGLPENPDAEVEFQTTSALARRRSLALDPTTPLARLAIDARHAVVPGGPGREEEFFSWFGVGQAMVGVPFWFVGRSLERVLPSYESAHRESQWFGVEQTEYFEHLLVGWRNPLFGALTAWLLVLSSRRLGAQRGHSWLAGIGYGLFTFAWPQARSGLSDVQATFFLILAFHQFLKIRESYSRLRRPRTLDLALAGASLGCALLTRVAVAPAIAVLLLSSFFLFLRGRKRRGGEKKGILSSMLTLYGTFALFVALLLYWNQARFGDPLETGYGQAVLSGSYFSYPPLQGLAGLFLSPGKGLIWMAPGILLFPIALFIVRRRDSFAIWTIFGVAVSTIALVAPTQGWHGAHTYGPRYLLPCLPFLWLGVAPALDAFASAKRGVFAYVLLASGLLTSLPGALVSYSTHLDLATRSARIEWPDEELELDEVNAEEERFQRIHWRWRFAAPWAHWRILRHRVAGLGEDFPLSSTFFVNENIALAPSHERDRGFGHIAWVDWSKRLGGPLWPVASLVGLLFALGVVNALRGLDPGAE